MKIKKLILHNFCQHSNLELEFSSGLNGIIGRNGAGKSNILAGILFALTGSAIDPLENYIKRGIDSKETSYVKITLTSDVTGNDVTIKRSIRPRQVSLTAEDTKRLTKVREIEEYLSQHFGIDAGVLKNIQIVPQEELVAFFRLQPNIRATILQRIYGVDLLQQRRDSLRNLLSSMKTTEDARRKIVLLQDMLQEKKTAIAQYKDIPEEPDLVKMRKENDEQLRVATATRQTKESYAYVNAQKKRAEADIKAKTDEMVRLHTELVKAGDPEANKLILEATETAMVEAQRNLDKSVTATKSYSVILTAISDALKYIEPLGNSPIDVYSTVAKLQKEFDAITSEMNKLVPAVSTGMCPTCGHPFPDVKERIKHYIEEMDDLSQRRAGPQVEANALTELLAEVLKRLREAYRHAEKDTPVFTLIEEVSAAMSSKEDLFPGEWRGKLTRALDATQTSYDESLEKKNKYESETAELKQRKQFFERMRSDYLILNEQFKAATAAVESAKGYLQKLMETKLPPEPSDEDAAQALVQEKACTEKAQLLSEQLQYAAVRNQLRKDADSIDWELGAAWERVQRDEELTQYKANLETILNLLHPDSLPRMAVLGMSKAVMENVNAFLTLFNATYSVVMDSNTELICTFTDGTVQPASRLSGGQKVILALAWRLALHSTFSTDESCGFLTLDEPTTFLDTENIGNLTAVIQQIHSLAVERNIQILIITHEASLSPLFDTVIDLNRRSANAE